MDEDFDYRQKAHTKTWLFSKDGKQYFGKLKFHDQEYYKKLMRK